RWATGPAAAPSSASGSAKKANLRFGCTSTVQNSLQNGSNLNDDRGLWPYRDTGPPLTLVTGHRLRTMSPIAAAPVHKTSGASGRHERSRDEDRTRSPLVEEAAIG